MQARRRPVREVHLADALVAAAPSGWTGRAPAGADRPRARPAPRRRTPTARPGCPREASARARERWPRARRQTLRRRRTAGGSPCAGWGARPRSSPAARPGRARRSALAQRVQHPALALVQRAQLGRGGDARLDVRLARRIERAVGQRRELGELRSVGFVLSAPVAISLDAEGSCKNHQVKDAQDRRDLPADRNQWRRCLTVAPHDPRYGPDRYSDSIRVALKRGPSVFSDARIPASQAAGRPAPSRS